MFKRLDRLELLTHHRSVNNEQSDSPLSIFIFPQHGSISPEMHCDSSQQSLRKVCPFLPTCLHGYQEMAHRVGGLMSVDYHL
mmetsp:Transcript_22266/g.34960  ORF Transcript_22266/g.34960 Transcript_22266/m.34960 type:complete len:82 (-) Transcript_22266:336-581(-)